MKTTGAQSKLATLKRWRAGVAAIVLLLTIIVFVRFFVNHPQYFDVIRHVRLWVILAVIVLNGLLTIVIAIASQFTLELCGHRIPFREQLLLTAYSSIANFFGPLQSGPGVRGLYLKTKHQVSLRDYTLATLIGYGMFATFSGLLLFGGSRSWWQTGLVIAAIGGLSLSLIGLLVRRARRQQRPSRLHFSAHALGGLLVMTFVQVCIVTTYYAIELHAVAPHLALHQAIAYAGAANFALFVSLTPDAIGIRESFLLLSRRLHHISTAVVFSANLIDRAAYALYLVLLSVIVLGLHGQERFNSRRPAHQ